jgi:DNA gyrase subunit A
VYWLKIYEVPDAGTASKGKHVSGLINLQPDETVKTFLAVKEFTPGQYIVMVTRHGVIKKCELTEFNNPRSAGIIAVALDDGDELLGAKITNGKNYIFLGSHDGMAIRFREDEVRPMGRPARGVRAMDLRKGDYLVGVAAVEEEGLILTLSENGYGKRTTLGEYRLTGRGCKGVINMKVTHKIGKVIEVLPVNESTDLMVITRNGQIIRVDSDTIRETGRSAQGCELSRWMMAIRLPLRASFPIPRTTPKRTVNCRCSNIDPLPGSGRAFCPAIFLVARENYSVCCKTACSSGIFSVFHC